jgi:hypothetical protein
MVQSTIGPVLTDLEREIGEEIRSRPPAHETILSRHRACVHLLLRCRNMSNIATALPR